MCLCSKTVQFISIAIQMVPKNDIEKLKCKHREQVYCSV